MALSLLLARAAERHALVERDVVADFRRLADDDACTVVDEQALADRRARMDLDARQEAGKIRDHARYEHPAALVERMRDAMEPDCMKAGITEEHFNHAARSGVALKDNADILAKPRKKTHSPSSLSYTKGPASPQRRGAVVPLWLRAMPFTHEDNAFLRQGLLYSALQLPGAFLADIHSPFTPPGASLDGWSNRTSPVPRLFIYGIHSITASRFLQPHRRRFPALLL